MRVLITDSVSAVLIDILKQEHFNVIYEPEISRELLLSEVREVDAIVVRSRTKVDKSVIDAGKNLRVIARVGVGLDNIDVDYAKRRGILVINAAGSTARSVAELAIGLMIGITRKIYFGYKNLLEGTWAKKLCVGHELYGKTLGIIGVGNIGGIVGNIAYHGFGMEVLGYRRHLNLVKPPIKPTELKTLLRQSDIISIHIPLNDDTRGFIDKEKINLMKTGAIIINTSRMEVLDLDAVITALSDKKLGGLAADTNLKSSDPRIRKLLEFDNVLLTPHIGAQTVEGQEKAARYIAQKLVEILREGQ